MTLSDRDLTSPPGNDTPPPGDDPTLLRGGDPTPAPGNDTPLRGGDPTPLPDGAAAPRQPLRRLLAETRPGSGRAAGGAAIGALTVSASVGLMAASAYLIQKAALQPPLLHLTVTIVAVRFFGISRGVLRYLERLVAHDAAFRLAAGLRVRFLAAIEPLAPAGLAGHRSGDLLRRFVGDVERLGDLHLRGLGPMLSGALVTALTVTVLGLYLPIAGLVALVALAVGGIVVPSLAHALEVGVARRGAAARGTLAAEVADVIRGGPELVAWGAHEAALDRVAAAEAAVRAHARASAWRAGVVEALAVATSGLGAVAVLAVAVPAVVDGRLDGLHLGLLVLALLAAFEAVTPLPGALATLADVRAAADRLHAVADQAPPVAATTSAPTRAGARAAAGATTGGASLAASGTGTGTGVIAVRGLTAVHPGADHAAVAAVDLDLRPGRTVAVVGESGSGKTTLARVLVRFVEIAGGTVTLDGVDVRDLDPDEVRRHVTLTGQDGHLFATSVRDNVRLARPDADDAVVRDALDRVGLTAWVDALPEGLDTEVGDDGARVSGGQHRRLLVARALVQGAPVLVADEPTAHLDTPTADAVLADLLGAASDRGLLLLTHRLDGLGDVDEIVVLDRGRVVERGRHHDLLAAGGAYHRLWTDQHPTPTPTPTAGLC